MYNVIVAGSTDFTRDCILQLMKTDNVNLSAVIAPIDTKKDRKGNIINSPTVEVALENNIKLFQPESINKDDFYSTLEELAPDFLIVVAYGRILNKRTLALPKIMPLNIHGSLLPILRGASPVEHALLYGFEKSGTTLQKMDAKLDEGDVIRNIEYDKNILKNEVDILSAPEKYLSDSERKTKKELLEEAHSIGLTDDIIHQFKTIKLSDKMFLYKKIKNIQEPEIQKIQNVCTTYQGLNWDNFDLILKYIKPIISNRELLNMIEYKSTNQKNSVLTVKVYNYIEHGYPGILEYEKRSAPTDRAVREVSKLTFNLFKYELVKYLGVFDLLFRFVLSQKNNISIDEVVGINTLLKYLEYNSTTEEGKKVSDYGVPFKVLHYVDTKNEYLKRGFDAFEQLVYNDIKKDFNI